LPLSTSWRLDANGHLTRGLATHLAGQPGFLLASLGRTVYALGEEGQIVWRARTAGPIYALTLLEGGQIALGDDAGSITALDAGGRRLWRHTLSSRITALAGNWQGGLLAGGWDEQLTFLDGRGEVRWTANTGGPVSSIATLPDLAVVSTLDGAIHALQPTGAQAWRRQLGESVTRLGAFAVGEGVRILASLLDGRLVTLDDQGALRWERTLGTGSPVWHVNDVVGDAAPEIVAGTGGDAPLLALLSSQGDILWRVAVPAPVGAVTSLDLDGDGASEILCGLSSGQIQAHSAEGRLRGTTHAGLPVWGLEPSENGSALVLADVVAWRLDATEGPSGGAWLPEPSLAPAPPALEPVEGQVTLAFLGDVSPGRSMEAQLIRYGPAYPWTGLEPLLREADVAMANLEGVLTTQGEPLDKSYLIRAHPRWSLALKEAGFDLVTLANNHALDYGSIGLEETLGTLAERDIAVVGAGPSREAAHRPAWFTVEGIRVAVLGYAAARWNGSVDVPATDRIAWAEPEAVQADVRAVRDEADLVVVLLHAGTEYSADPSTDQVAVAHAAVDGGADLVVGHHPHVTQTVEHYRQGLIVYSLGDALFDIPRPAAMRGHLLRVLSTREGLVRAELWPFWIEDTIRPRLLDDGHSEPIVQVIYP
jgi:poly-gamma-glutamate synthesis protein (capsule biosynthesis protein)